MASVAEFLAQVRTTGLAKPNRFDMIISNPPCVQNSDWGRTVSMMVDSGFFPTTRLITSRQQLWGPPEYRPVGVDYGGDNFSVNILVDRQMKVKYFFDAWMDGIVSRNRPSDKVWHVTNYQKNYITTIYLSQLDESGRTNYVIKLEDCFPNTVNPLVVDNNLSNTVHKLNVTFNFRRWSVANPGQVSNLPSLAINLLAKQGLANPNLNIPGTYNPALSSNPNYPGLPNTATNGYFLIDQNPIPPILVGK